MVVGTGDGKDLGRCAGGAGLRFRLDLARWPASPSEIRPARERVPSSGRTATRTSSRRVAAPRRQAHGRSVGVAPSGPIAGKSHAQRRACRRPYLPGISSNSLGSSDCLPAGGRACSSNSPMPRATPVGRRPRSPGPARLTRRPRIDAQRTSATESVTSRGRVGAEMLESGQTCAAQSIRSSAAAAVACAMASFSLPAASGTVRGRPPWSSAPQASPRPPRLVPVRFGGGGGELPRSVCRRRSNRPGRPAPPPHSRPGLSWRSIAQDSGRSEWPKICSGGRDPLPPAGMPPSRWRRTAGSRRPPRRPLCRLAPPRAAGIEPRQGARRRESRGPATAADPFTTRHISTASRSR